MSAKPAAHDRYLHLETEETSRAPEDLKSASSVILRAVLASITTTTTHSCTLWEWLIGLSQPVCLFLSRL